MMIQAMIQKQPCCFSGGLDFQIIYKMSGIILASPKILPVYASTVSNINLLISDSCDYSTGKISDRKMRSKMEKYYKRIFQDAMEMFDEELVKITAETDRMEAAGIERRLTSLCKTRI